MPVYEYECKTCQKTLEVMQRFDEPPLLTCESCGGELRKLISNTSFVLKGNGWYITDYARRSETPSERSEGDKKTDTEKTQGSESSTAEAKKEVAAAATTREGKSE
jgi:putative FmdB family regulatory protein